MSSVDRKVIEDVGAILGGIGLLGGLVAISAFSITVAVIFAIIGAIGFTLWVLGGYVLVNIDNRRFHLGRLHEQPPIQVKDMVGLTSSDPRGVVEQTLSTDQGSPTKLNLIRQLYDHILDELDTYESIYFVTEGEHHYHDRLSGAFIGLMLVLIHIITLGLLYYPEPRSEAHKAYWAFAITNHRVLLFEKTQTYLKEE